MKYYPIKYTSISNYGYDEVARLMEITMKGETYHYHGVDASHHSKMISAESPGAYFNQHVRPKFKGVKVSVPVR